MVSLQSATFTTGPHPFPNEDACQTYIDDVIGTAKAANTEKPDKQKIMMIAVCLLADKEA